MTRHYRRYDDEPSLRERPSSGPGVGTLLLVAALGAGIGLLAAPETGVKTRRRLRRRLSHLGSDLGEGVQELGGRARERMRARLAALRRRDAELEDEAEEDEEEEDAGGGALGTILALAAGAAASYFLSSDRAAPARTRMRETADTVRRRAADRWERFQRSRGNGMTAEESRSETAGGVPTSDEPPLGS